jgi:hypothetical protein
LRDDWEFRWLQKKYNLVADDQWSIESIQSWLMTTQLIFVQFELDFPPEVRQWRKYESDITTFK